MTADPRFPVDLLFDAGDELGEGVTWDAAHQRLLSVDIMRGRVHVVDPATGAARTLDVGQPVGAVVPWQRDALMAAVRDGFARLDLADGRLTLEAEVIYAVREEMALRLEDVVFRRTGLGTIGHPGRRCLERCAHLMAAGLGWDAARQAAEIATVEGRFIAPPA